MIPEIRITREALVRNTALNLIGQALPAGIGVFAVKYTIGTLGVERFGVLAFAWLVLGYSSLLDFGLGRATIRFVADATGRGATDRIRSILWGSLVVQLVTGLIGAIAIIFVSRFWLTTILSLPRGLVDEAEVAVSILGCVVPVILVSSCFKGFLEARQRFDVVNAIRIVSNSLIFLMPAVAAGFGLKLPGVIGALVVAIGAAGISYCVSSLTLMPDLRQGYRLDWRAIRTLFGYGVWVSVSAVIVPILIYSERFMLGSIVSVGALAYYSIAYELASRLQIVPWSFATTLFPSFCAAAPGRGTDLAQLYVRSVTCLIILMTPLTTFLVLFGGDVLRLWLGPEFEFHGRLPLQILAVGMFMNAIAQIPANLLDAVGRPDLRAKIFLTYLVPYLVVGWFLTWKWGLAGAALAWTLRAALEVGLFSIAPQRAVEALRDCAAPRLFANGAAITCVVMLGLAALSVGQVVWLRAAYAFATLILITVLMLRQVRFEGFLSKLPRHAFSPVK